MSASAHSDTVTASRAAAKPPAVRLRAPREVTEGDRFKIKVRVRAPKRAKRVRLLQQTRTIFGDLRWTRVKSRKVKGRRVHTFKVVATEPNEQRYRARVSYRRSGGAGSKAAPARTVRSTTARVKVWRWVGVAAFRAYDSTEGVQSHQFTQFAMNGDQYRGWSTYGSRYGMWESRHTLGRHCKALRADAGVTDASADGSTGQITLLTDDSRLYQSPPLIPGTIRPVRLRLALPYRITIQGRSTAEDQLAYPALGDMEFLCTGL